MKMDGEGEVELFENAFFRVTARVLLHGKHDGVEYDGKLDEVIEGRRNCYNPEETVGERIETGAHKSSSEVADFFFVV